MSSTDPITTGITVGATLGIAKRAEQFITAAMNQPGEDLATILGTAFHRRLENLRQIGNRANLTLLNLGVQPTPIPLKIIQPMVEGASLEEDTNLQEKWANLMANAADPRRKYDISPLFQSILRELSPRDAVFLDAIHKEWDRDAVFPIGCTFTARDLIRIFREAGLGPADWLPDGRDQTSVEAEEGEETVTASEDFEISMDILTRTAILRPVV